MIGIGEHFYTSSVTERDATLSTNSFLVFGFRPSSIV